MKYVTTIVVYTVLTQSFTMIMMVIKMQYKYYTSGSDAGI